MKARRDFLRLIRQNPAEDTHRLVYADWLDENGCGDLDTATAQFIRVSCQPVSASAKNDLLHTLKPSPGSEWLSDNWRRLCPSLVAEGNIIHPGYIMDPEGSPRRWVRGLVLAVDYDPPEFAGLGQMNGISFELTFERGFCSQAIWRIRGTNPAIDLADSLAAYATVASLLIRKDHALAEITGMWVEEGIEEEV